MENTFMSRRKKKIEYLELEENGKLVVRTTDNMQKLLEKKTPFIHRLYNIVADDPRICVISIPKGYPFGKLTTIFHLPMYMKKEIIDDLFIITKQGVDKDHYLSLNDSEKYLLISRFTNGKIVCELDTSLPF